MERFGWYLKRLIHLLATEVRKRKFSPAFGMARVPGYPLQRLQMLKEWKRGCLWLVAERLPQVEVLSQTNMVMIMHYLSNMDPTT